MDVVDPANVLGLGGDRNIEIDDDRLLPAPDQDALERLLLGGVDLLVRNVRRDEDEVAWTGLGDELEPVAPAHPGPSPHHVDHALELAVMMRPGPRVGIDSYRPGPQLLGAGRRRGDRGGAIHPRRLRRVRIELARGHDADAVKLPARFLSHARVFLPGGNATRLARDSRIVVVCPRRW